MKKVIFSLVAFLAFPFLSFSLDGEGKPAIQMNDGATCNLPAPTGLVVTSFGSNEISVAWASNSAPSYLVQALDANTQAVFYSNTTTNTYETCVLLPSNTLIEVRVYSICGNGTPGEEYAFIQQQTDFVVDIVANGYQECTNPGSNIPPKGQSGGNPLYPIVENEPYEGVFTADNGMEVLRFNLIADNKTAHFFDNSGTAPGLLYEDSNWAVLHSQGVDLAQFRVFGQQNQSEIYLEADIFTHDYNFVLRSCNKGSGDTGHESSGGAVGGKTYEQYEDTDKQWSVAPNPFHDWLTIIAPGSIEPTDLNIELTDLSGRLITKMAVSQVNSYEIIRLNTQNLTAGSYLLRTTSSSGLNQVKLVCKTQ